MSNAEQYAIVSHYRGYAEVTLAAGLELALRAFLMEARLVSDIFTKEFDIEFVGQDDDLMLPRLTLLVGDQAMVSLQAPSYIDGKTIENGELRDAPMDNIPYLENEESLAEVAGLLNWGFKNQDTEECTRRSEAAMQSWPAVHLSRDYNEILKQLFEEANSEGVPSYSDLDSKKLLAMIDKIKLSAIGTATVVSDE